MFRRQIYFMLLKAIAVSALPLTLIAVLPTEAKAASLSSSKDRTAVVLFRGFGQTSNSGLDILNQQLETRFGGEPNRPFDSRVFPDSSLEDAFNYIKTFNDLKNVVVVGYSLGANTAFELSTKLQPETVNLLVEIDGVPRPSLGQTATTEQFKSVLQSSGFTNSTQLDALLGNRQTVNFLEAEQLFSKLLQNPGSTNVNLGAAQDLIEKQFKVFDLSMPPTNVNKGINYFAKNSRSSEPQGIKNTIGFENIDVQQLFSEPTITHSTITNNRLLLNRIESDIAATTGLSQSVPESSSALGLLAFGALSAGFILKGKQQKNKKASHLLTTPLLKISWMSVNVHK